MGVLGKFIDNCGLLWYLLPFYKSSLIKNKFSLALSFIIGSKNHKLKIDNGFLIHFPSTKFLNLLHMIGILSYSYFYKITSEGKIELSFDGKTTIIVPTKDLSHEDENLLELLFMGMKYGVDFIFNEGSERKIIRDKTIKIFSINDRKIIEVYNGVRFYLDSIHPSVSIIETYVRKIHMINLDDDFTDKIVLDVGAECGDTALYYASLKAKVYSFEPIKANFDDMIENISLNPKLKERIIPINAAIGEDKILKFYQDQNTPNLGASFVYNIRGDNPIISEVQGYSLETAIEKFGITHVDLLKTDCKNCEFFFNETSLRNVDKVKIETVVTVNPEKHMNDIITLLENCGFECSMYKITPHDYSSTRLLAHILGKKSKSEDY
tara:strand:+ start:3878 stop:5017 length:1140 start_codon:yes stop_codon:yes gene_type:complete